MQRDFPRQAFVWLTGSSLFLLLACGGGDGTGPPSGGDDAAETAAAARASKAATDFEQFVTRGDPDPVGTLVASLEGDPGVTDVQRFDSGGTVVATLNGVPFGVLVAEEDRDQWTEVSAGSTPGAVRGGTADDGGGPFGIQTASAPISCSPTNYPQSNKACILRSTLTAAGKVLDESIEQSVQRAGFEVLPLSWPKSAQEVVQLHQTLGTCGVLYIRAHGGVSQNLAKEFGNHVVTEVEVPKQENREILGAAFGDGVNHYFGRIAGTRTKKTYLTLAPQFFASVKYPNTLVFLNACGSGNGLIGLIGGGTLRDAFRSQGAGAYLGWLATVDASVAGPAATEVFDSLAPKVATIDAVAVTITPPNPGAGQKYTPSVTITPAQADVQVRLSVRGTDGFTRDTTQTTDAGGSVTFADVPGGQGGVIDTLTVVAGGASNSATAYNAVLNSPTLTNKTLRLPWLTGVSTIDGLDLATGSNEFNLVCNNQKLTKTLAVVKFSAGSAVAWRAARR